MSLDDDDRMLDALQRAIGPDDEARPSQAERDALRQLVLQAGAARSATPDPTGDRESGDTGSGDETSVAGGGVVAPVVSITRARRWRHRVAVGGVAVVVGLSGATAVAAAANNGALPDPVRYVVHAVGIPVDSVELADAKDALRKLRTANDDGLAGALDRADKAVAALSASDHDSIRAEADQALADGRERLAKLASATTAAPGDAGTSSSPSTPTSVAGSGSGPATSVDDHGGKDGGSATSVDDHGGSSAGSSTPDDHGSSSGSGSDATTGSGSGSGGHGSDDTATTAATTDTGSGSGSGSGGGGGSGGHGADDTTAATNATSGATNATTATTEASGKKGGDSTVVTNAAAPSASATTTATTDVSGKGGGKGTGG